MIEHPQLRRNKPEGKKDRIFRLFHKVLRDYAAPANLYIVLLILEAIQMLAYAFHPTLNGAWTDPFLFYLKEVLLYISTQRIWELTPISIMVATSVLIIVCLMSFIIIGYEVFSESCCSNEGNMLTTKFLGYLGLLTKTILTLPVASLVSAFLGTKSDIWVVLAIMSVLCLIMYFACCCFFFALFVDNSPFSPLPFASCLSTNELFKQLLKCALGLYGSIISIISFSPIIYLIVVILVLTLLLYRILQTAPMIRSPAAIIHDCIYVILWWVYFCALLQVLFARGEIGSIYFCVIGSPMMVVVWLRMRLQREEAIIYSNYHSLSEVGDLIYYNHLLISYVESIDKCTGSMIKLEGILTDHIFCCNKSIDNCVCRGVRSRIHALNPDGDRTERMKQKKQWYEYIKNDLSFANEKYKGEPEFSLLIAYIEKNIMHNNFKTLKCLEEENQKKSGIRYEFLNYHQKRVVQSQMEEEDRTNNQRKPVDVNKYLNFQMIFGKMESLVLQSAMDHMNFWKGLKNMQKSKEKIIKDGHQIFKKVKKVKKLYQQLTKINQNNIYTLVLYSNYTKYILNNPQVLNKNNQNIRNIKKNILKSPKISADSEKNKYGENSVTGIIIISGQRKNIGIIKHCTTKVTQIIQYSVHELVGQNINTLMPMFIGNMHDDVLYQYLEMAESKYDFVERVAPMIDKHNFLVLSRILTKPLPSLINGLELVGLFQPILELHIKHQSQQPKYILYRCDTGKVQSLSESCFQEYGHKITKINKRSETSEDLNFGDFFFGIKDSDIGFSENGYAAQVRERGASSMIDVIVYIRLQIFYFGVKLKLLYMFNEGPKHMGTLKPNKQQAQNPVYKDETLSGRTLSLNDQPKTEGKKTIPTSELIQNKPFKIKLIVCIGLFLMVVIIVLASVQLYLIIYDEGQLHNYYQNTILSSDSIKNVMEIAYYARKMQIESISNETDEVEFERLQANLGLVTSKLQQEQFELVNWELLLEEDGFSFDGKAQTWKINQVGNTHSNTSNINSHIFDYVTTSSTLNSISSHDLQFSTLLNTFTTTNQHYRDLFRLRYTSLFESQPIKAQYHKHLKQFYLDLLSQYSAIHRWLLVGTMVFITIVVCVLVPLLFMILNGVYEMLRLFSYLSLGQMEKEAENCFLFVRIFFKNFYLVNLHEKQSNCKPIPLLKKKSQKIFNSINTTQNLDDEQNDLLKPSIQNITQSKTSALKQQQELTSALKGNEEKEKSLMENKMVEVLNVDDEQYDQSEEKEHLCWEKLKFLLLMIIIIVFVFFYFILTFLIISDDIDIDQRAIDIILRTEQTIQLIKILKLYSIESALDNSKFESYPLLNVTTMAFIEDLYRNQRELNEIVFNNQIRELEEVASMITYANLDNLCTKKFYPTLIYEKKSYSEEECLSVGKQILKDGLRASIVGYCETARVVTQTNGLENLLSQPYLRTLEILQKYLVSDLEQITTKSVEKQYNEQISQERYFISAFCIFILITTSSMIGLSFHNISQLNKKIIGTNQIISLIPMRLYDKNIRLATEYQKYVKFLMK